MQSIEKNNGVESRGEGEGGEIVSKSSPLDDLPEECISNIISFTSPRDACVAASVSKTFESAANSDSVWKKFLPLEYASLVPPSRDFSSKKELYFSLCDLPVLIQDGEKSFWLEKASGKRCIMLSPKQLEITPIYDSQFWQWISVPESRFVKVPELLVKCPLDFRGVINPRILSPETLYSVYIVYKTRDPLTGFQRTVGFNLLRQGTSTTKFWEWKEIMKLKERKDGWREIEIGDFFNDGGLMDCDVYFHVNELKYSYWHSGLIIQGIEIRPVKK